MFIQRGEDRNICEYMMRKSLNINVLAKLLIEFITCIIEEKF